jgi:Uncharacterized protein conserved in bacteria
MKREATLSPCGSYRFDMTRTVERDCTCERCLVNRARYSLRDPFPFVLWVLCNPSIANAEIDDPTERRCWGFTSSWGYSKMVMVNTNPHRSTDPKLQRMPDELTAVKNHAVLALYASNAALIVCAWGGGANHILGNQTRCLLERWGDLHHLGLTKAGTPKHPLYLSKETKPQLWTR